MKKVLFVYDNILHYRIPLFNILAEKYDFTVLHSGKKLEIDNLNFHEIHVSCNKKGPIYLRNEVFSYIQENEYDILIFNFDLRYFFELIFLFRNIGNPKFLLWGAWLTKSRLANYVRLFFLTKSINLKIHYDGIKGSQFYPFALNLKARFIERLSRLTFLFHLE